MSCSSALNLSVWLSVGLVPTISKFSKKHIKRGFLIHFPGRYLKDIELFAPERKCSGNTLKVFPRATAGMAGAFVSGYVS